MIDYTLIRLEAEQRMARACDIDPALVAYLEDLRREQRAPSLRSRLAGLFVGFALKLDPRAIASARLDVRLVEYD